MSDNGKDKGETEQKLPGKVKFVEGRSLSAINAPIPRNVLLSAEGQSGENASPLSYDIHRTLSVPLSAMDQHTYPKISLGICAMDRKARSKPMRAILERLNVYDEFNIMIFGDDLLKNAPPEEWPACDTLMAWHSDGFPLDKARAYVQLHRPFLINDTHAQDVLLDRRRVYDRLIESGIPVPKHIIVSRNEAGEDPPGFVEAEDYVEYKGKRIMKPFVEKPADGEDHNINIYYPHSMGGGVKRLFRKVGDKSADYEPDHPGNVRRSGSFIYEEFLTTGGTDVKVYTVGPRYAHAEARKSPVVDGKVLRTADGKEIRFPVLLSPAEKEIARMVSLAFRQKVCGFDLLRSQGGKSYVCDVNGWSFVKNSKKYYDDAAGILRTIILSALAPHRLVVVPNPSFASIDDGLPTERYGREMSYNDLAHMETKMGAYESEMNYTNQRSEEEELRCVLAVVRHGDRTPKQKMKMKATHKPLLDLFMRHKDAKGKQAKLKSPVQLQELLDITRELLKQMDRETPLPAREMGIPPTSGKSSKETSSMDEAHETRERFRIVRTVLEQGGHFSGINRKVQLKPLRWGTDPTTGEPCVAEVLLILKHGGVLTHAGRQQAEMLGSLFRTVMYPQVGPQGGGLLRLHSTYRHDLKIYSSDEGRVQASAAAFTKSFLDLEGNSLTPILVSLVNKDATMLDAFGKGASDDISASKDELYHALTFDPNSKTAIYQPLNVSTPAPSPPRSPAPSSPRATLNAASPTSGRPERLAEIPGSPFQPVSAKPPPGGSGTSGSRGGGLLSSGRASASDGFGPGASGMTSAASSGGGSMPSPKSAVPRKDIPHMPEGSLQQLHRLVKLMTVFVDSLREKCLEEGSSDFAAGSNYGALNQDPTEWQLEAGSPCGNERLLLMFDRWRKLLKSFWSSKRGIFDISKVPDIYDSIKYDAIHNTHLGLDMTELYKTAKLLADAVIPNEYGIDPDAKLRIGSKIAHQLLGKLLQDLDSMRQESMATAVHESGNDDMAPFEYCAPVAEVGAHHCANIHKDEAGHREVHGTETDQEEEDMEHETIHRLAPTYADDINSPLRHVRTRIYFTSESHIHSLINVLRFAHSDIPGEAPLLSDAALKMFDEQTELDYLTQIIFRLYENKQVPSDSPDRFRVELLFSPGAAHNPLGVTPIKPHVIPTQPRGTVHAKDGVSLEKMYRCLTRHATPRKMAKGSSLAQHFSRVPGLKLGRENTHSKEPPMLRMSPEVHNAGPH